MIKLDKLMIGDWFQTTYPSGRVVYRKVTGIFNNYVNTEDGTTNAIEPIPITPEILEKNRFERGEDKDLWAWYSELERVIWIEGGITKITSVFTDSHFEGWCHDVHQLQHALKLCGINKNIIV
ncbi:MAG: hypothetical protein J6S67_09755 [Methanobrevibacter sp.]|nr:hypothetical protein [Methanobrevibacter sp.]